MPQTGDILYGRERDCFKTPEQIITSVTYSVILFRKHERDPVTEKQFDAVLQMTLKHVLTERFKKNTKLTAKVTNINNNVSMLQKHK